MFDISSEEIYEWEDETREDSAQSQKNGEMNVEKTDEPNERENEQG